MICVRVLGIFDLGVFVIQEVVVKNDIKVENLIYEIRGKHVMLDFDLARVYDCKNGTKQINQAVKRHLNKFPERFMFQLNNEECVTYLRSQIVTSNNKGGRRYNPYAFTEEGVAMLATVLRTKVAEDVSIKIMDAFVSMRHYMSSNLLEQKYINNMVIEHDYDIKILQESFDRLEKDKEINELYFNGKIYDAYSKVLDIFGEAKDELIVVDRYTDKTFLDMIKNLNCNVTLITGKKSRLTKLDIDKYNSDYHNLSVYYDDTFHDRYFIIDKDKVYHSGNSINHIGYRKSSIDFLQDDSIKKALINDIERILQVNIKKE